MYILFLLLYSEGTTEVESVESVQKSTLVSEPTVELKYGQSGTYFLSRLDTGFRIVSLSYSIITRQN